MNNNRNNSNNEQHDSLMEVKKYKNLLPPFIAKIDQQIASLK